MSVDSSSEITGQATESQRLSNPPKTHRGLEALWVAPSEGEAREASIRGQIEKCKSRIFRDGAYAFVSLGVAGHSLALSVNAGSKRDVGVAGITELLGLAAAGLGGYAIAQGVVEAVTLNLLLKDLKPSR